MKKNHWRDWPEKATDPDLWTAHNYVSAPPGDCRKTRILDLTYTGSEGEKCTSMNKEKGRALARTFFPEKPTISNVDDTPATNSKPSPICKADPITSVTLL